MNATVNDPFLLAAYALPSSSKTSKGKSVAADERPYVFAAHSAVPKREDGQVTLAVQGDGIHVFDLADLHPVSSHTLGPSTSFASAPTTLVTSEGERSFRRTYVAIQSAQDVKHEDSEKVVWSWKEEATSEIGSSQDKNVFTLPHDASYILATQSFNSVIIVARNGRLTQADLDLNVLNSWSPEVDAQKVVKLFVFARRECNFTFGGIPANGVVLLMFVTRGKELYVQIIAVGQEGEMVVLEPHKIFSESAENVIDVSCDASGHLSILESSGLWSPFRIDIKNGVTGVSTTSSPLHLTRLSFISEKRAETHGQVSLLSLGSSYVLLASLTSSPEIALLLWDTQYGVLLHSHMLTIPSTLEKTPSMISLSLTQGSPTQALLILSPRRSRSVSSQLRSSVLVVPLTVPRRSTIANAMGRAAQSTPWLISDSGRLAVSRGAADASAPETDRLALLEKLQEAVEEERIEDADGIFFNWVKGEDEKDKATAPATASDGEASDSQDAEMEEVEPSKTLRAKRSPPNRKFDHAFVTRVLQIVLHPENLPGTPYSPKICRYLLSRHLVSHSMVDGGLLSVLIQHNDWDSIHESIYKVIDIPESELLRTLHAVVKHNRPGLAPSDYARTIAVQPRQSTQSSIPSISTFLVYVVEYPSSQVALRKALREHFADINDLICLLEVLDKWMQIYSNKDLPVELGEVILNEHSVPVARATSAAKKLIHTKSVLPAMMHVLNFLQAVLDSSFLALLQNPPSHALLQRLSENIMPHVALNEDLESLRGPLTPFVKAQVKAEADASGGKRREEVDWRKRRKQVQEQVAINLGPYQVEELVF